MFTSSVHVLSFNSFASLHLSSPNTLRFLQQFSSVIRWSFSIFSTVMRHWPGNSKLSCHSKCSVRSNGVSVGFCFGFTNTYMLVSLRSPEFASKNLFEVRIDLEWNGSSTIRLSRCGSLSTLYTYNRTFCVVWRNVDRWFSGTWFLLIAGKLTTNASFAVYGVAPKIIMHSSITWYLNELIKICGDENWIEFTI